MTLRSHKKRQITALTFSQQAKHFKRLSIASVVFALSTLALTSSVSAQSYNNAFRSNSSAPTAANAQQPANTQPEGWDLRYRKSKRALPQPHHVTTQDVFAKDTSLDAKPRNTRVARASARVPNSLRDQRTNDYYQGQQVARHEPTAQSTVQATQQRSLPTPVVGDQPVIDPSRVAQAAHVSQTARVAQAGWNDAVPSYAPQAPAATIATNPRARHARAKRDFFSNPFGESGSKARQPTQQQPVQQQRVARRQFDDLFNNGPADNPSNSLRGSGSMTLPPPSGQPDAALTPEALTPEALAPQTRPRDPSNQAAGDDPDNIFNEFLNPKSTDTPTDPADDIRDMLREGPGDRPTDDGSSSDDRSSDAPGEPDNTDDDSPQLPKPNDSDDSPSDREDELYSNPFDRDRARRDKEDLQRLRDRKKQQDEEPRESESSDADDPNEELNKESGKPAGISCEEFRQRIKRETISTLSLDISPPFRPDVFSQKEYAELKGKFEQKQYHRPWRSMDGSVMANGRFIDIAYGKAVIATDSGVNQTIPMNRLSEDDLAYISENWGLPRECRLEQVAMTPRTWVPTAVTWKASNLCHKPLYFEEVNLERYGHTAGPILQPIVSSAHFFANIAVLPYKMGIHPPSECQYALGYYRPGDCAPWIVPPVPISLRGAVAQAAAVTTGFWLIP